MSFGNSYFEKNQVYPFQINQRIEELEYAIIIPAYNEPTILKTLNSLWNCTLPKKKFSVIICINSNENSHESVLSQNEKTEMEIKNWIKEHPSDSLPFFVSHYKNIPYKFRGAGMARKLAMDDACNLFNKIENPNGVIISLDADVVVENNFLFEIDNYYSKNPNNKGAVHYFEHPIEGNEFSENHFNAIINYELYLRYFNQALRFTGFPYIYHTVGSCFSVKAKTYISQGGMNRQHAGEDFYFIQKIAPLGNFGEINSTTVYPSPRISDRVPFGTGPEIAKILESTNNEYLVYNFDSIADVKKLLTTLAILFQANQNEIVEKYKQLPDSIKLFLTESEFVKKVEEVNSNTATKQNFLKRIFHWFNAFKIIKYLNFIHDSEYYKKSDVFSESMKLLSVIGKNNSFKSKKEILFYFRELDKRGFYHSNLLQQ